MHIDLNIAGEIWTCSTEHDIVRRLTDPHEVKRFRADHIVPIFYHGTFQNVFEKLDLREWCIFADEVQNCTKLVEDVECPLFIGMSARKDKKLNSLVEKVVELDEKDEERMRNTGQVDKIILRIDALRD
jgi:hypothetical protein